MMYVLRDLYFFMVINSIHKPCTFYTQVLCTHSLKTIVFLESIYTSPQASIILSVV